MLNGSRCAALGFLFSLCVPANAQIVPDSGSYYLPACRNLSTDARPGSDESVLETWYCAEEIETLNGLARLLPADARFCKPVTIPVPEMANVAVRYMDAHQDKLNEPFTILATAAFHDAWPCP